MQHKAVRPEHAALLRQAQDERRVEGRADLHLHTCHSDGTFAPEELVRRAKALKLSAISITDHDTVDGIAAARAAAAEGELEIIPGVEITVAFRGRELHILGYGLHIEDPAFRKFLDRMQKYRVGRLQAMIDRLREQGVASLQLEEVLSISGEGSPGRPHLAQALVEKGAVPTIQRAFDRYLGDDRPCFVKGATLTVSEAVRMIRAAGGAAALAHPHRLVEDSWMPELVAAGIQGIEVFHSDHDPAVVRKYRALAEENNLLMTGGSDCHGHRKSKGPLIGSVTIPYEWVERLKQACSRGPG